MLLRGLWVQARTEASRRQAMAPGCQIPSSRSLSRKERVGHIGAELWVIYTYTHIYIYIHIHIIEPFLWNGAWWSIMV